MRTAHGSYFSGDITASEVVPKGWQLKSSPPQRVQTERTVPLNIWFWSRSGWWSIKTLIRIRVSASCVDWLTALWSCFHWAWRRPLCLYSHQPVCLWLQSNQWETLRCWTEQTMTMTYWWISQRINSSIAKTGKRSLYFKGSILWGAGSIIFWVKLLWTQVIKNKSTGLTICASKTQGSKRRQST